LVESTATIKLRAVDSNVVSTINNVSAASTNALIGATALAGGFKLLENASNTSVARMAVGANNAQLLSNSFGKLADAGNKATQAISKVSTAIFYTQQLAIAADGLGKAYDKYARIPQAMQAMQASGVGTYQVEQFNNLTAAIKGSDIALDSLLVSSIAELGEFEQAAARAGTILKSSLRFDGAGNPLTANATERLENALSVQKLVGDKLNNSVTSTQALTGQYEVLSSGFTTQTDSQEVLEQGLKLVGIGEAGGVAVDTTATLQLLTKTLNAYTLEAGDAGKVSAKLNAIVENGLTTIPELANGFGAMATQAAKANIGLDDSAAAVATLTVQGTSTAEALTGIARISSNIIDKTPEAEKELAKLQIRGQKIRFDKAEIQAKGFTQALIDLYDAAGGSAEVLTQIFPEDVAYRTVNALLTEQGRKLSANKEAIAGADEAKLNEIFEIAKSDRVSTLVSISNRFKESIIQIGQSLAPTLEPGINALETISRTFANLPEPVRKAIGAYLAFKIQSKAVGGAIGEIVKTLAVLATNYLSVRLISLALTGQLGKEASAIKALITQKKGLAAATLQLVGIDQKWRLEQTAATAAMASQGKVATATAAAKTKAAAVVKTGAGLAGSVAVTGLAATSGISKEQVLTELEKRKQQAIALAQVGSAKATQYAQQLADKYGFQLPVVTPVPGQKSEVKAQKAAPIVAPPPPKERVSALDNLVTNDRSVAEASSEYSKQQRESDKAEGRRQKAEFDRNKAIGGVDQAEIKLAEAKNKAIASTTNKQAALAEVTKRQQKLTAASNLLNQKEFELTQLNTASLYAQNRAIAAGNTLEQQRLAAKAKYLPLAKAITSAQKAEVLATKLNETAIIAKLKAEQAEVALGNKSKITMMLKRDAKLADIMATNASELASKRKAIAIALETKLTEQQFLAEQGLYKARIFGRTVTLSEVGLMGSINKLLTTNITLAGASAVATSGLAKTKAALAAVTSLLNVQIGIETVKLGAIKGIRSLEGAYLLLSGAAGKTTSFISGLTAPLGALAPLLGVAAIATIALRDEFFGLGKDARNLTKSYQEFLKEQDKLNTSISKRSGLTAIEGKLEGNLDDSNIAGDLTKLKDSGALTASEFNNLRTAFNNAANGGNNAKESLQQLRTEIKKVKADAQEIDKGVINKIFDGIKKTPGLIGKGVDRIFNNSAAALNTVATGKIVTRKDIAASREASKLIEPLSVLGNSQAQAGDRFIDTTESIISYRENLVLTSEAQNKVRSGFKLSTADLANEQAAYQGRADRNRQVIEGLEKTIAETKAIADKTKNEDNKQLLENQIEQTIRQKEALEAQTEALKQLEEETKKYLTETLPAIQTALKENFNPQLALTNAADAFSQTFLTDADGKVTKLLKPIEILRDEGSKLIGQIQENMSFGLLDNVGVGGEVAAAEQIKAIRDNQISLLEDGNLLTGYRYSLGQRREITSQIVDLENADLKRAEAKNKLEIDLIKSLAQAQLETTESTNVKVANLQQKAIANSIQQKENEIAEFKKLGLRTIDLELQLEALRIQQQSSGFESDSAKLQQELAEARFLNQQSELETQKLIANAQKLITSLNQQNTIITSNVEQYQNELEVKGQIAELSNSISKNEVYNAGVAQKLAVVKLANFKETLPLERSQLENQIKISKEQNQQNLLEAQTKQQKAELAKYEAQELFNLSERNGASSEQLERMQLQIEQSDLALDAAKDGVQQAQFQLDTEGQLSDRKLTQFEVSKKLQENSGAIAISQAKLAETEAKITREYELRSRAIEVRSQKSEVKSKEFNSIVSFRTGELSLALQVTNSEREKLKIAQQLAALKLRSLRTQIASEAEVLAINQQQAKLQLKAKQDKTGAELQQNVADILKIQADNKGLKAKGASKEEIEAGQAQYDAAIAQRQVLLNRASQEKQESSLLNLSQAVDRKAFVRESQLKIDTARVEAVETLPEDQKLKASKKLAREFIDKSGVGFSTPNVLSAVDSLSNFTVRIPDLKIPKIELPSLDDIKADVRAILSEFNVNKSNIQPNNPSNTDSSQPENKKYVIQNLSMDSPINITISGASKEEIAQKVEGIVYNAVGDSFRDLEKKLNSY
jgi:hypothetical protein